MDCPKTSKYKFDIFQHRTFKIINFGIITHRFNRMPRCQNIRAAFSQLETYDNISLSAEISISGTELKKSLSTYNQLLE